MPVGSQAAQFVFYFKLDRNADDAEGTQMVAYTK